MVKSVLFDLDGTLLDRDTSVETARLAARHHNEWARSVSLWECPHFWIRVTGQISAILVHSTAHGEIDRGKPLHSDCPL
jgi:FMN phosphatase YigB (HAD superfamily)